MSLTAFKKDNIKIVLLEGVEPKAVEMFANAGYQNVEYISTALSGDALIEKISDAHFIGIRSRTNITKEVLQKCKKLKAIGCFCIGTNQVDLQSAASRGVVVFNAPFANTRSVAEATIALCVMLMRGLSEKNLKAHRGEWQKSAKNSFEVRGKKLGIVGYGNIGTQVSMLASGMGMHVQYYDTQNKLRHGNAQQCDSLKDLLETSDIVSLHVPETPETKHLINSQTLAMMKDGSFLINYARGTVVDIDALIVALDSGKILGAALDVFPIEPKSNTDEFISPLRGYDQVIMTPHIGGSTQEAQQNIGAEVVEKLIKYSDNGSTDSAVNFPEVSLPSTIKGHRILHIHENKPGILSQINAIFQLHEINIQGQYLQTNDSIGYVVMDISTKGYSPKVLTELKKIEGTKIARILY